jgi:hypothetical protein
MSATQLFSNNAVALLETSIGPTDLSINLQTGLGEYFPQPVNPGDFFLITLETIASPLTREIVKIIGRSGDTLIVDPSGRAWENPNGLFPAQSWTALETLVDHRITAYTIKQAFLQPTPSSGGYVVGGHWFQSDSASRIQQLSLVVMGANLPPGIQWKTLAGTFVAMTQTLAVQIFQTAAGFRCKYLCGR